MKLPLILSILLISVFTMFTGMAYAQESIPDLGSSLAGLITAIKAGTIPAIIVAVVQMLRTEFVSKWIGKINSGLAPLLVLVLGLVSGVLTSMATGQVWHQGLLVGLFNGGYAMAIYDVVVKHFVKK